MDLKTSRSVPGKGNLMNIWMALFWGGFAAAALYIGQLLAGPMARANRLTGLVMGFGAGTLLSAVAYELVPESTIDNGLGIGVGCLLGAITYYVGNRVVDAGGGRDRKRIAGGQPDPGERGTGMAMFLGALLDGIPESFILGMSLALGGTISIAFLVAVFVSNIPEGIAGTVSLKAAGYTDRHVFGMWTALILGAAAASGAGFALGDDAPNTGLYVGAFAAGGLLVMLADSMMPEAFKHGGRTVGLLTVVGYLVAATLSVAQ